jgi:heptosyltransferase-2
LPRITPSPLNSVDAFVRTGIPTLCLAPGSAWATKRWPVSYFGELASAAVGRGFKVILIGGPDDIESGRIIAADHSDILNLIGNAKLLEAAYAIERSDLLIGNDSSPVHLATAVGTKSLVIFGPTVPQFGFAPPALAGDVIERELWCRPCTSHGSAECPVHTHDCMRDISPLAVLEKALSMLRLPILGIPFLGLHSTWNLPAESF